MIISNSISCKEITIYFQAMFRWSCYTVSACNVKLHTRCTAHACIPIIAQAVMQDPHVSLREALFVSNNLSSLRTNKI